MFQKPLEPKAFVPEVPEDPVKKKKKKKEVVQQILPGNYQVYFTVFHVFHRSIPCFNHD
jgi:hypothetical protein